MAENCTHDCSSCSADCSSRDLRVPANAMSSVKRVIAVVSGKGGVGKSTVTASLAAAMAKNDHGNQVLGGGDHDHPVHGEGLEDGEGHVAGAGGHVHEHIVHVAPDDLLPELNPPAWNGPL